MHRSTSAVRRACAVGTTVALVGLTTGLGIMTATAASAAEPLDTTQPVVTEETPAPAPAPTDEPAPSDSPAPADETPAPQVPSEEPTTPATTEPAAPVSPAPTETPAPEATAKPTATPKAGVTVQAEDATVTITGKPKVGSLLSAVTTGFDSDLGYKYEWKDRDGLVLSKTATYEVDPTDVRTTITVAVTGTLPGATETTTVTSDATAPVTQDPAFLDTSGTPTTVGASPEHPLELSATAGDAFSHVFRAQGSPTPTYALAWFDPDDAELAEEYPEDDYAPEDQLPEGLAFDASTGELSGTTTDAYDWEFAVTATSGTESVTQYVSLTVEAGAAAGILVTTTDRAGLFEDEDFGDRLFWIIEPDGSVITLGGPVGYAEGGRPTIEQGGTLIVAGGLVDRWANPIGLLDDDAPVLMPTVTSDVASDVIAPDPDAGDYGVVDVTFPHASVHNLTVASGDFATSFAVDVQPTAVAPVVAPKPVPAAAPVAPVTPANTGGQLAYTGSDATGALPWALGLLVAGAGLVGARALRRRHAQR
ncbi:hypothetical protein DEI99_006850 [Curtobacterium sp. MCLR17_036]|uniref:putative Ig domain-containing protein n=1 Tax=Curtobacterium sp. MCLR17_036 TaxID=2175620 RepID=UPI0024E015ED|nr:putative Ig domain-containing protein [Curtobacterium sp. MCLR17_036]WIE66246.1 hypothetical protein DEI99_006850 [Curtobacterium sp. MCLR17_036]